MDQNGNSPDATANSLNLKDMIQVSVAMKKPDDSSAPSKSESESQLLLVEQWQSNKAEIAARWLKYCEKEGISLSEAFRGALLSLVVPRLLSSSKPYGHPRWQLWLKDLKVVPNVDAADFMKKKFSAGLNSMALDVCQAAEMLHLLGVYFSQKLLTNDIDCTAVLESLIEVYAVATEQHSAKDAQKCFVDGFYEKFGLSATQESIDPERFFVDGIRTPLISALFMLCLSYAQMMIDVFAHNRCIINDIKEENVATAEMTQNFERFYCALEKPRKQEFEDLFLIFLRISEQWPLNARCQLMLCNLHTSKPIKDYAGHLFGSRAFVSTLCEMGRSATERVDHCSTALVRFLSSCDQHYESSSDPVIQAEVDFALSWLHSNRSFYAPVKGVDRMFGSLQEKLLRLRCERRRTNAEKVFKQQASDVNKDNFVQFRFLEDEPSLATSKEKGGAAAAGLPVDAEAFESKDSLKIEANAVEFSQAKKTLKSPIKNLSDEILAKIFAKVEPIERLHLKEVCRTWNKVARIDWTDIKRLDLSSIPAEMVGAILKMCPNLEKITGHGDKIILDDAIRALIASKPVKATVLARADNDAVCGTNSSSTNDDAVGSSIQTLSIKEQPPSRPIVRFVSFYNAQMACASESPGIGYQMRKFLECFPRLEELIIHNVKLACLKETPRVAADIKDGRWFPAYFVPSLRRLQLTGIKTRMNGDLLLAAFSRLPDLECLLFGGHVTFAGMHSQQTAPEPKLWQAFGSLTNLRELCVTDLCIDYAMPFGQLVYILPWDGLAGVICTKLNKLQVLLTANSWFSNASLTKLTTTHPTLRIMGLAGLPVVPTKISLPKREHYPNGFDSDALPFLHIFIVNKFAEIISFTESTYAAKIHPITSPLPGFLDQPEIAEIFKGVWLAEKMREAAKAGVELWSFSADFGGVEREPIILHEGVHYSL